MKKHMSFTSFVKQLQENAKTELTKGTKREMEHTDDPKVAAKIAKDHVKERPDYYSKLDKCMPEDVQIDEISHRKAWNYIHKADDQMKDLSKKSVYGDTTKDDYKTIAKRARGLSMAKDAAARGDKADSKRRRDKAIEKHGTEHGIHQSGAFRMRHYPGKTDAELQKIKDEIHAHNKANPDNKKRVRLQGRLGKDNPNADHYKQRRSRYQSISKAHAAYHDVYVNSRNEEVEVDEAAWADRAADRMGKYHAQSGTNHNLNQATRMFGADGAKKYDSSYRDEKKSAKGNKYLKIAMDKRDAKIKGNMTWDRVKNEEVEQIDELSKGKLLKYIKKAGGTSLNGGPSNAFTAAIYMRDKDKGEHFHKQWQDSQRKSTNRARGVMKAVDKVIAKEETDVNEGGFMTVGHKVNVTNPKATPRYTITSIGKGRDGKVGLERDGEHRGEFPKSRIIKTNRAAYALKAKQFKGFSEEQIDELSNDKLKSYVSRIKDRDEDKGIYSDDAKTYEKRRIGLAKARGRGVTEAREEDHFATKHFSVTKIGNKKHYFYEHPKDGSFKWADTAWDAMDAKRKARSAYERHTGKVDEETVNELSRKKVGDYIDKSNDDINDRDADIHVTRDRGDRYRALKKQDKRIEGNMLAIRKMQGYAKVSATHEETVNEISKKAIGRYIKKAHINSIDAGEDINVTSDTEKRIGLMNRQFRREKGIGKAVNRLTKEETVDEMKISSKFNKAIGQQKGAVKKLFRSISGPNKIDRDSGAVRKHYALAARKALGPKRPVAEEVDEAFRGKEESMLDRAHRRLQRIGTKSEARQEKREALAQAAHRRRMDAIRNSKKTEE